MIHTGHPPQVGAPDPELKNSPIADEESDDFDVIRQELPGDPRCYFNNESYPHGSYVRSGETLLRCDYGVWVRHGGCDPGNP